MAGKVSQSFLRAELKLNDQMVKEGKWKNVVCEVKVRVGDLKRKRLWMRV